jgi:hypothetical protein
MRLRGQFFLEWKQIQMAADMNGGELPSWLVTLGASALTAVGGFVLALVNRGPAMQSAVDGRMRTLIDGYERRVDDLTLEVHNLREEVINLRRALADARLTAGFGA